MRSHRKLRNFYRFITSDTDQTCLKIPKKFTRDHRKQILLNNNVLIIVSDDKVWPLVWTVSEDGKLWLQKGWPEFYQHYCLTFGHLLYFKHLGKSIFHVRIFDPRYQELYNLQPEEKIKNNNRSFEVTVRKSYLESSMLYVPVRFYRRYLSSKKKGVRCVLQMAQGGSWGGVKCRVYEGYAKLCGQNWKRFRCCLFFGQKHFWPLMSASRRYAQTFGSCSLFVFQKHFSPFTSSPPLPHTDISLPLLTSSHHFSCITTQTACKCQLNS